jgi:hypothetical protein
MQKFLLLALTTALSLAATNTAQAASLSQGFDDIADLASQGWVQQNNSNSLGSSGWFQGDSSVFPSQSGNSTSYMGANVNNTTDTGTISNWLLTPILNFSNGDVLSFFTRTTNGTLPDRLEVRLSLAGNSTDVGTSETSVGDFTTLLLSVNPELTTTDYPTSWTQFTATISGLSVPTDGRLGFRYFVTDAGILGNNSDYIGIDTVTVVPEPSEFLGLLCLGGFGIAGLSLRQTKRRSRFSFKGTILVSQLTIPSR